MIDILEDLHKNYGLVHNDVHPGNWLLGTSPNTELLHLIDYGVMTPVDGPQSMARDIREAMLGLRWLIDMNNDFYAPKHMTSKFNIDIVCPSPSIPKVIRQVVEYVFVNMTDDAVASGEAYLHIKNLLINFLHLCDPPLMRIS